MEGHNLLHRTPSYCRLEPVGFCKTADPKASYLHRGTPKPVTTTSGNIALAQEKVLV